MSTHSQELMDLKHRMIALGHRVVLTWTEAGSIDGAFVNGKEWRTALSVAETMRELVAKGEAAQTYYYKDIR